MKTMIWLSYDLGVQGDYDGLYAWLDAHKAQECGDSLAVMEYEFSSDLLLELKKDLSSHVKLPPRSRIYVIRPDNGSPKGRFVFGSRKSAPWTGYAVVDQEVEDSEL